MTTRRARWDNPDVPAALDQASSAAASTNQDPPHSEADAARKKRVNNELLDILKQARQLRAPTSIRGVGLYTHAANLQSSDVTDAQRSTNATFLPIGGPNREGKKASQPLAPIDGEVLKVFKEVRQAVNEEEQHASIRQSRLTTEQLKERYGGLDPPQASSATVPDSAEQKQVKKIRMDEYFQKIGSKRRTSRDVVMGRMGGDTGEGAVTHTNPSLYFSRGGTAGPRTHLYDESRDPRKR